MTWQWLTHNEGNRRLILIFAGWGTDASFYSHISRDGWDVAVVSGYSDFKFPLENLEGYDTISLFAWSLGVYAASQTVPADKITLAVAINGTEFPVDDHYGIPERIFSGTLDTLTERNLMKFRRRMAGESYNSLLPSFDIIKADIGTLKKELDFIRHHSFSERRIPTLRWNRVYISDRDMIFPAESQKNFWQGKIVTTEIITLDSPHYVDLFPIIKGAIPSHDKIGARFRKALPTYDEEASAQAEIASRLIDMYGDFTARRVVELGSGSGLFSRLFAASYHPEEMHFVDLYQTPRLGMSPQEVYHIDDAEEWIAHEANFQPGSFDAIISASAIQWFANPRRFFQNASILLKHNGILLCSSFICGNLEELREVNPYGIVYRSEDEIRSMLTQYFTDVEIAQEEMIVSFPSARDLLRHLIATGTGGDSTSGAPLRDIMHRLPTTLTYRPVLIRCRSPHTSSS